MGRLILMVDNGAGSNNRFRQVDQIFIVDINTHNRLDMLDCKELEICTNPFQTFWLYHLYKT